MTGTRRDFTDQDYPALVALIRAVQPDSSTDEAGLRHRDATRVSSLYFRRWLWEVAGEVVASAVLMHMDWVYDPDRYFGLIMVHPDHRRRGIGKALYATQLAVLAERGALSLRTQLREGWDEGLRFVESRGYRPGNRELESALDLTRFDPARFADALERAEAAGLTLLTYNELEGDPDRDRKLWEFDKIVGADMPMAGTYTVPPFEDFKRRYLEGPHFYPEGHLIAVDEDGGYMGLSLLSHSPVPGRLETGLTGVMRELRGRGVAMALKVKVLSAAKAAGYAEVRTGNDSTNDAMLAVNRRLGFEPLPAWTEYQLEPLPAAVAEED